jgi:Ca2+-binding RTX toxin-like protein
MTGLIFAAPFLAKGWASEAATPPATCVYLDAGPPGPEGNELQITEPNFGNVAVRRSGNQILAIDQTAGPNGQTVDCAGPASTVQNIDLVHVTVVSGEATDYTYFSLDETGGMLEPGATPENDGQSEIEVQVDPSSATEVPALWVKLIGQPGPDQQVVDDQQRTLIADLDGAEPTRDPELTATDASFLEIFAGPGDDRISVPGSQAFEHSTIKGQDGNDVLSANGADIFGGPGDDVIQGGWFGEFFSGNAGNDRIFGGKGPDHLKGGPGRDHLNGGPASDVLRGGPGKDKLRGGPGGDRQIQ